MAAAPVARANRPFPVLRQDSKSTIARRAQAMLMTALRKQRRLDRLDEVRNWLRGRWYGATKQQIMEQFPEWYAEAMVRRSADQHRYYQDRKALVSDGEFVLTGQHGCEGRVIIRADRVNRLSEDEL